MPTKTERRAAKRAAREEARKPHATDQAVAVFLEKRWGGFVRQHVLSNPRPVVNSLVWNTASPLWVEDADLKQNEERYDTVIAAFRRDVHPDTPFSEIPRIARLALEGIVYEAPVLEVDEDHVDEIPDDEEEAGGDLGGTGDGLDALTADQLRKLNAENGHPVAGARIMKKARLLAALRNAGVRVES